MFKSIRWTLLFWYGLILVLVVAGFGATLYVRLGLAMRTERDTRLREWALVIARSLDDRRPDHVRVALPEPYARILQTSDPLGPYYVVWDPWGRVVARSRPGLDIDLPDEYRVRFLPRPPRERQDAEEAAKMHPFPPRPPRRRPASVDRPPGGDDPLRTPLARNRASWREVIVRGPRGATVLVGQSGEEDRRRLREFLTTALAASAGALGLAMVGGWFLAAWTLAPIARISEAASGISASNLSRRIDVRRTENELGKLATVLNVTFDRLEAAFVRQVRFTADASHELRTPLAVLIAHCELALRKDRSPDDYRRTIETSLKSARRMTAVIEGLLTLARADASAIDLEHEPVDLAELVEEGVAMLRPLADPAGVSLEVEAEPVAAPGDRERLREVIGNLLTNAVRYNCPGGRVAIALRREPDAAVLEVADTGIGIPEKDRPRIFERFFRAEPTLSRDRGGCGLGLAISKWIVEAHGGLISFSSREGEGTTFTVRLPLAPAQGKPWDEHGAEGEGDLKHRGAELEV